MEPALTHGHLEVMFKQKPKTRNQYVKERGNNKTRPVIPALWRLGQDCVQFVASLGITKAQSGAIETRAERSGCSRPRVKTWKVGGQSCLVSPARPSDPFCGAHVLSSALLKTKPALGPLCSALVTRS